MAKTLLQVQQDVLKYQMELKRLYINGRATDAEINYTRGRLIAALKQEYLLATNPYQKNMAKANLLVENGRHYNMLRSGVKVNKQSAKYSITKELGLKMKKIASISTDLEHSQTKKDKFTNGAKLAGQTLSTAFTVLKLPTTIALRTVGAVAPYVGMAFSQIFQIPAYMLSKFINPEGPYNGQAITNMGAGFGKIVKQLALGLDNGIMRL